MMRPRTLCVLTSAVHPAPPPRTGIVCTDELVAEYPAVGRSSARVPRSSPRSCRSLSAPACPRLQSRTAPTVVTAAAAASVLPSSSDLVSCDVSVDDDELAPRSLLAAVSGRDSSPVRVSGDVGKGGDGDSVVWCTQQMQADSQALRSVGTTTSSWASLADEDDEIDEEELAAMTPPTSKCSPLTAQPCLGHEASMNVGWQ
jgi:hypothetical protein